MNHEDIILIELSCHKRTNTIWLHWYEVVVMDWRRRSYCLMDRVWIGNIPQRLVCTFWEMLESLGDVGSSRRKQVIGWRGRSLGISYVWLLPNSFSVYWPPWVKYFLCTYSCHNDVLPKHMGPNNHGLNPLEPQANIDLSSLKLSSRGFWSQLRKVSNSDTEFQLCKREQVLWADGGDSCTTLWKCT
jgi:hypothetical protein